MPTRRGADWVAPLAILFAASAIAWFRLPPIARFTMWAEDGSVFLQRALDGMPLLTPYEGYLHLVPQAIATATAHLAPIDLAAPAMNAAACLVAGGVAALVYFLARDVVPSRSIRLGVALVTVLAPLAPIEVLGNTANVHWLFLWLAPWLLLYRPRTWVESSLLGIVGLVASLTEIQVLLFLPLLAIPAPKRVIPLRAGIALGVIAQVVATIGAPRSEPQVSGTPGVLSLAAHYVLQVIVPAFTVHGLRFLASPAGVAAAVVLSVGLVLCVAVVLRLGTRDQRILGVTLAIASPAVWCLDSIVNRLPLDSLTTASTVFLRHAVVPSMYLLAIAGLAFQVVLQRQGVLLRPLAIVGCAALALVLVAQFVPPISTRDQGPSWPESVAQARAECSMASSVHRIPIAPMIPEGRWVVTIDCSRLGG